MILLRTTAVDTRVRRLADRLAGASGLEVAMLVDERQGFVDTAPYRKLSLDASAYRALGLFAPADVGWRCGDYGFYLARRCFPDVRRFWMIEYDVRIAGDAAAFFSACAVRTEIDALLADYRPSGSDWWWWPQSVARDVVPHRCFFPVSRLSATAVDRLYAGRASQSRRWLRQAMWPNDEAFVATTMAASGLAVADFNELGRFYDCETFSPTRFLPEDPTPADGRTVQLFHPIRPVPPAAGATVKVLSMRERAQKAILKRINRLTAW